MPCSTRARRLPPSAATPMRLRSAATKAYSPAVKAALAPMRATTTRSPSSVPKGGRWYRAAPARAVMPARWPRRGRSRRPRATVAPMPRTGRDALFDVLRTEGVTHVFGNPGSTELPLMDALASADDLHYVLALQEATAVGMADGYAQATGRPSFVNLHTSAGLGNGIGNLTNAQANTTPMVVTAGQQDYRHIEADPLLAGDLVALARPVSTWSHEVRTLRELGTIMRRAFHDATAPPSGPVFVSIPMSTLDEEGDAPVPAPSRIDRRVAATALDDLASLLIEPGVGKVAIVAGDEVAHSGAVPALVEVAE